MNLTLDQYIDGLERSAKELPSVLSDWDELAPELCCEYADQLDWMLQSRDDVFARAVQEGRFVEVAQRIAAAVAAMFQLRDDVRDKMGIATDRIVPYVTRRDLLHEKLRF